MTSPRSRFSQIVLALAIPVSMLLAAAIVWQASSAAFEAGTHNPGNDWSAGHVNLTDDDGGQARFQAVGLVPGDSDTKCIKVTSGATVPGEVRLYTLNARDSALAHHILVTVKQGSGGTFADGTGFTADSTIIPSTSLATIATTYVGFGSAAGSWMTTSTVGESMSYEFSWTFDVTGLTQGEIDALQNLSTGIDFEWELQSS